MVETYYADGNTSNAIISAYSYIVAIAIFVYVSFMQYRIAHKTGQADTAWWAFVPILNTFLLIRMSGKPTMWFLLLLVPLVNVVTFFVLWINVAKNCYQSPVWGFLVMIPLLNMVALFVLAYSSRPFTYPETPTELPSKPRTPQRIG